MRKRRVTDKQSKNAVKQAFGVMQALISVHKEIIVWDEKMHTKPQKPCVSGVFLYPRIFMGCPETWWKFVDMQQVCSTYAAKITVTMWSDLK